MNLTGPQDLRSDAAVNAPGLPFGSSVSHLELKRSATQKCQMSTGEENSKKKSLHSLEKGQGEGPPGKKENL